MPDPTDLQQPPPSLVDSLTQQFLLENERIHRTWTEATEENVDATHPLTVQLYIPSTVKQIQSVILRLRLLPLRYYNPTTAVIATGATAAGVTVTINGTDRTAALGGPFNADQASLTITNYLTATGWNTIALGSTGLGRIHAKIYLETYAP